jgi:hypothetical protein
MGWATLWAIFSQTHLVSLIIDDFQKGVYHEALKKSMSEDDGKCLGI